MFGAIEQTHRDKKLARTITLYPHSAALRLLSCLIALLIVGCSEDPAPPDTAGRQEAADAGRIDSAVHDTRNRGDVDRGEVSADPLEFRVDSLTTGVVRSIERVPLDEPVFVIFGETADGARITVYETADGQTTTHDVSSGRGEVVWWHRPSGKFGVRLRHVDMSRNFMRWLPSNQAFQTIGPTLHSRFHLQEVPASFPSGYGYAVEPETDELVVVNFKLGFASPKISDHQRNSPLFFEPESGRALFTAPNDTSGFELMAYDPGEDRLSTLGPTSQQGYRLLESGRVIFREIQSNDPVKLWSFDDRTSTTLWENSYYSPPIRGGRFVVLNRSETDSNHQTVAIYDDRRDQVLFTDHGVDALKVRFNPHGTMAFYPRYRPHEGYGEDAELIVRMLDTDEEFIIADRDLYRDSEPTFAPDGSAVAAPLESGGIVLWSNDTREPKILGTTGVKGIWPSPKGRFWVAALYGHQSSTTLEAFDLTTREHFVLGTDPRVAPSVLGDDCPVAVAPAGSQVFASFGPDSEWGEPRALLWSRANTDAQILLGTAATNLGCPTFVDESGVMRGALASQRDEATLLAWEGSETWTIENNRVVRQLATGPQMDSLYYTSFESGDESYVFRLDEWDFASRERHSIGANVKSESLYHDDGLVAFLENRQPCIDDCPSELRLYQPALAADPITAHSNAHRIRDVIGHHVFFRGTDADGNADMLMVASPIP